MKHTNVLYIFAEQNRDDIVKIGKCSKGGFTRFQAGAFMNPRLLEVVAMWKMKNDADASAHEKLVRRKFTRYRPADGVEWYTASRLQAVDRVSSDVVGRPPDITTENLHFSVEDLYVGEVFDNFRETKEEYHGNPVQYRIWIHEERGGAFRKVSRNTWWCESGVSSNAKSTAYNTYKLTPVACTAIPLDPKAADWSEQIKGANRRTLEVYERVLDAFALQGTPAGRAGWTSASTKEIVDFLHDKGFTSLEIDPTKAPRGVKSLKFGRPAA